VKRSRGFSLLEILVVLLVVGLFSALSVAWLDTGPAPMQRALDELADQTRAHAALARHSGQVLGMRWNGHQPEFVRLQTDQSAKEPARWVVDSSLSKSWPENLKADWPASGDPNVVFTPTGVAAPVVLNWRWPEGRQRWQWLSDNSLSRVDLP
jgi:general secretion pathway protein H